MTSRLPSHVIDEISALVRSGVGFGAIYFLIYTAGQFAQVYAFDWIDPAFRTRDDVIQEFLMLPVWRTALGLPMFLVLVFLVRGSFVGLGRRAIAAGFLAGSVAGFLPLPFPLVLLLPPLAGYLLARTVDWRLTTQCS